MSETEKLMPVGSDDLFCPDCGARARHDHNSITCNYCGKLWPKGHGYEQEGFQAADLRNRAQGSHGLMVGQPFDSVDRSFRDGPPPDTVTELRKALRNVMAAVGMFETHPIPATGRCVECHGTTVAPGVHKCRNCAKEAALKILGQNK